MSSTDISLLEAEMDTNRQRYTQWLLQAEEVLRGGFTSNSNEDQGTGKEWGFRRNYADRPRLEAEQSLANWRDQDKLS